MSYDEQLQGDIATFLAPKKALVKRRGRGQLRHDYLVPGGPYEEQWDWDAFFIGCALAAEIPTEAVYLRNWALNYIENARTDGFTPGLVTPSGPDARLNHMKPLLAQGSLLASRLLDDNAWLTPERYEVLKSVVLYRERNGFFDAQRGLFMWTNSMESGADNNVALLDFPDRSVLAVDASSFVLMEYAAMADLAVRTRNAPDVQMFSEKADLLRQAITRHMWSEEHRAFLNIDLATGNFVTAVGYSSVHPFCAGIADRRQADAFFESWLLNTQKLRSPFGIRTLSKDHPAYNNVNMIKPHSNWQGPLWPIATYFYAMALVQYGRAQEAMSITEQMTRLCVDDIKVSGGMHENYDAETGLPLAAPNFVSWNLLLLGLPSLIEKGENPFALYSRR